MTVRTRKTITDLIQQLKVQEKEIKSGLSDGQRRLNETRDRISTLYWVIEEIGDWGTVEENFPMDNPESYRLTHEEVQVWKDDNPHLTDEQIESLIIRNGWLMPLSTVKVCEPEELEEISKEEWEELVKMHPSLSGGAIDDILQSQGLKAPLPYDGCPCKDCHPFAFAKDEPKPKAKAKKKISKKPTKKGKK